MFVPRALKLWIRAVVVLAGVFTTACSAPLNIIVIQTDDQRAADMSVMPNVRRLIGGHGYTFTRSFTATPLCCPSRATFLTGQSSFKTGVWDNEPPNGGMAWFDDDSTLATWLSDAGYATSFIGKYLNGYELLAKHFVPPGWTDWHGYLPKTREAFFDYDLFENGRITHLGHAPGDYLTDVMTDRAEAFIERTTNPYFMYFAPFAPHGPAVPAPRDKDRFKDDPPYRPKTYDRQGAAGNPTHELAPLTPFEHTLIDHQYRNGRASLLAVDRAVARLVKAVEEQGQLDNTVFIFTSDNGLLLGEHRILNKHWAYEPSIRVPLVVRVPWANEARTDEHLVVNTDLTSTIAELAGVQPRLPQDGRSLVPLLRGDDVSWRDEVLIEFYGERVRRKVPPRYHAIRTDRYKLIVYEDGSKELYDLKADPDETKDLAEDPKHAATVRELERRLDAIDPGWPSPKPAQLPTSDFRTRAPGSLPTD